jgi:hypothetical protein
MPNYNFKIGNGDREDIISHILNKKTQGAFKVIDVGGSLCGWSSNIIDAIMDFNDPVTHTNKIIQFKCDITHPDSWKDVLQYVKDNGKFDFCICTHTLEDIMNPIFVCEQIQKIANEGYIAFPSKYRELSRFEGQYRGYIHHRWIFDASNNNIIAYPKINYIDSTDVFNKIAEYNHNVSDLSFYWKDSIDISYINNNYLGPDVRSVIGYYNNLLI